MFLCLAILFAFVHGGLALDYEYKHIGCFTDKNARAMPYMEIYLIDPIRKCSKRALRDGYKTFGLQFGNQCYGGPDASLTYDEYGTSKGCSAGVGGQWANDVYQWPEYIHVGCYEDDGDERALPKLLGTVHPTDKAAEKCAALAKKENFPVFSLQNGDECWSGPDSEDHYDKHGEGTGCKNGVGGAYLNDVYSFERYYHIGCYKDKLIGRAIPWVVYPIYPSKTAVANCAAHAESEKAIGFAVQHDFFGRQCYYIKNEDVDYSHYGESNDCDGGVGGSLANDVYMFY